MIEKRHVIVEWLDACACNSWLGSGDIQTPSQVFTTGWVHHESDEFIQIVGSYVAEDGSYNQSMSIPRGMVVSIKEI
jgi:hypothetical protein